MPGAGSIDVRSAQLRLVDGLLALYHGAAIKHAEKVIFHYFMDLSKINKIQLKRTWQSHYTIFWLYTIEPLGAEAPVDSDININRGSIFLYFATLIYSTSLRYFHP